MAMIEDRARSGVSAKKLEMQSTGTESSYGRQWPAMCLSLDIGINEENAMF